MRKEWFFDQSCGQELAALSEDGKLAEFFVEPLTGGDVVGNIYKGRVVNILSGMQAAFVACGLEKNCYLSFTESNSTCLKYDGTVGTESVDFSGLKEGDEVIVQITKPPRGNKGAKVTTHLSFVGKNLIYLPDTDFLGISRKITDESVRESLLAMADKLRKGHSEGFVMRTSAPKADKRSLKQEAGYLKRLYASVQSNAAKAAVGELLYEEFDLPLRIMRDSIGEDVSAIYAGNRDLYDRLYKAMKLRGDFWGRKLKLHTGERSLLREHGISDLVADVARPNVALDCGGYLVIDHTEAMTVVDVNTGSYVGDTNLEETAFKTNLDAARETARQVRLRNIGGIVVVDFIDMTEEAHRDAVTKELETALAADRAKCRVLPMSDLCLTQFTRKRVGNDVQSFLVKPCEHCAGRGYLLGDSIVAANIRSDLMDCFANGYTSAIIELNVGIMRKILDEGLFRQELHTLWRDKRVYMIPHKTYSTEKFSVRGDNSGVLNLPDNAQILY